MFGFLRNRNFNIKFHIDAIHAELNKFISIKQNNGFLVWSKANINYLNTYVRTPFISIVNHLSSTYGYYACQQAGLYSLVERVYDHKLFVVHHADSTHSNARFNKIRLATAVLWDIAQILEERDQ